MPDVVKRLLKINEIVDQVFLVKQVIFYDQSYIEDLFSGASPAIKSGLCIYVSRCFPFCGVLPYFYFYHSNNAVCTAQLSSQPSLAHETPSNYIPGNDILHDITSNKRYELRVDMEDYEGEKRYATYSRFALASEDDNYRLKLGSYCDTAGNLGFANLNMLSRLSVYPSLVWCIYACCVHLLRVSHSPRRTGTTINTQTIAPKCSRALGGIIHVIIPT